VDLEDDDEASTPRRSVAVGGVAGGAAGREAVAATALAASLPLLVLVSMVQPIAMNMYVPAMAQMQRDLATSASAIQLTLSTFLAATALGQLVAGPLSDIYGRRPALLAGFVIFLAGTALCVVAPDVQTLIVGRIVQALGGCTGLALARAIIRDIYGPGASASMIGYVTMGMAVGPMVTPAIGGAIAEAASWRLIFVAMGGIGLVALVSTWAGLSETRQRSSSGAVLQRWSLELAALVRLRDFWLFALTLGLLSTAFFSFVAGGVFVATEVFGLSASQYGLFFIMTVSGYVVGNFVVGRYGVRLGILRMILWGNGLSLCAALAAGGLALAGVSHPLALFGPMVLLGLGNGFALPNAVAGAVSVRPQLAGTASGLAGAFQVGSGAVASVIVGLLIDFAVWDGTVWPMLLPMLCGAVAAFLLSLLLPRNPG